MREFADLIHQNLSVYVRELINNWGRGEKKIKVWFSARGDAYGVMDIEKLTTMYSVKCDQP